MPVSGLRVSRRSEPRAVHELEVTIELVGSSANRADQVTRVPNAWLQTTEQPGAESSDKSPPAAVAAITDIRTIHENIGHQGVRRTLWYARRELGVRRATKTAVRDVVKLLLLSLVCVA